MNRFYTILFAAVLSFLICTAVRILIQNREREAREKAREAGSDQSSHEFNFQCQRCKRWYGMFPPGAHWTMYEHHDDGSEVGMHALCERCWEVTGERERVDYTRKQFDVWKGLKKVEEETWPAIEQAVREGK